MLFVVHYIGEQFIVCLFYQFFDSFVVGLTCQQGYCTKLVGCLLFMYNMADFVKCANCLPSVL